jgi:hypothetical protein
MPRWFKLVLWGVGYYPVKALGCLLWPFFCLCILVWYFKGWIQGLKP